MEIVYDKNKSKYHRKAFTLVEILVSISILSILIVGFTSLMGSSIDIFGANKRSYEIQTDVLYASNSVNEVVRDSTAMFILNSTKYDPANITEENINQNPSNLKLTKGWNYIGANSDKTKLYNFIWDENSQKHIPFELTVGDKDSSGRRVEYSIDLSPVTDKIYKEIEKYKGKGTLTDQEKKKLKELIKRSEDEVNVLSYSVLGKVVSSTNEKINEKRHSEYESESIVQAVNTKQIFDLRNGKQSTAIAYRTTPIKSKKGNKNTAKPVVAIVLDFSGSMQWNMDGKWLSPSRIGILKAEFEKLINQFETIGGVDLYVVPFSAAAFDTQIGHNGFNPLELLKNKQNTSPLNISSKAPSDSAWLKNRMTEMKASGGTYYADGLRVALQYLKKHPNSRTYLLVLSDGQPNMYRDKNGTVRYDNYNHVPAMEEIKLFAKNSPQNLRLVHLIGFSNVPADNSRLETIKTYFTPNPGVENVKVTKAGSAVALGFAFEEFKNDLEKDLWYFDGP